jgi:hypothetical protein
LAIFHIVLCNFARSCSFFVSVFVVAISNAHYTIKSHE